MDPTLNLEIPRMGTTGKNIRSRDVSKELVYGDLGLAFTWKIGEKSVNILLSNSATNGKIFDSQASFKFISSYFANYSSSSCKLAFDCCIVICNSGEVYAVLLEGFGFSALIGNLHGLVIWAGFLGDYVILLQRCGKIMCGFLDEKKSKFRLCWKSVTLSLTPICCATFNNNMIISDGYFSYLYEVKEDLNIPLQAFVQSLPYQGIVRLEKKEEGIIFHTLEATEFYRKYDEILTNAKSCNPSDVAFKTPDLDMASTLKNIERASETIREDGREINKLDSYIVQLNISQLLLSGDYTKPLYKVMFDVTSMGPDFGYRLLISITQNAKELKFKGPWWRLSIKVKNSDVSGDECYQLGLNRFDPSLNNDVSISIPYSFVRYLVKCSTIPIVEFTLLFSDFIQTELVCHAKVHEEPLDLPYFLSHSKIIELAPSPFSKTFFDKLPIESCSRITPVIEEDGGNTHYKTFVVFKQKHLQVFASIFPKTLSLGKSSSSDNTIILWLHDISIHLSIEIFESKYYKVSIESSNKYLVRAVRYSFENRLLRSVEKELLEDTTVELLPKIYKEANLINLILDVEASNSNPSPAAIRRAFESIHDLICSIPF